MDKVLKENKKSLRHNPTVLDVVERLKASDCVVCGIVEDGDRAYIMLLRQDRTNGRSTTFKLGTRAISSTETLVGDPDDIYLHITMCESNTGMMAMDSFICPPDVVRVMDEVRSLIDSVNKSFRLPKAHREMIAQLDEW